MYKAYKFRIYLDTNQKIMISKTMGCNRYVYNYYLNKMKEFGYERVFTNILDYTNNLKYKATFLQEVDSIIIRQTLFNLDNAFQKMFKEHSGYPRYKNKYNKSSYNTCAIYRKYKIKADSVTMMGLDGTNITGINVTLTNNSKDTLIKISSLPKIKIKKILIWFINLIYNYMMVINYIPHCLMATH